MGKRLMDTNEIVNRLKPMINSGYKWPEVPSGWQLEFIAYPGGELDMDLLHPVSARFWSEDNDFLDMPIMGDGHTISVADLKAAGVPFMTTFGTAAVSDAPKGPHLKAIENTEKL